MITMCTPERIVVEWRHSREISRRNRRLAWPQWKIARQLRPEGRLQGQVFPRNQHSRVGEITARQGDCVIEYFKSTGGRIGIRVDDVGKHLQREMMIAHHEFVAG